MLRSSRSSGATEKLKPCKQSPEPLLVGLTEYRRTMRRPWPKVPPLDDDDDWYELSSRSQAQALFASTLTW